MKDSLAFHISILRKCFTRYCTEELARMGVTYGQIFVLIYLGKYESCAPKELAHALDMDPGYLNRTIAKLSENGFLKRRKNEKDRRANVLTLTPKGRAVYDKSHQLFYQWDDLAFSSLTPQEKETLLALLDKASQGALKIFPKL
ncbi:MAG: MarR family transcriptional regulator [Eubacteriales bacterium]|nr:MarR family transcriptional regulator [Eubacteriales bacterium]